MDGIESIIMELKWINMTCWEDMTMKHQKKDLQWDGEK